MSAVIVCTLQTIAVIAAGFALYRLWRVVGPAEPRLAWLTTAGFLVRAFAGQLVFWIGYLNLPIAPHLQVHGGFWFFGLDGLGFYRYAQQAISFGPGALVFFDKGTPGYFYVQIFAIALVVFGIQAAVGLLLNTFAYLGMAALIVRWNRGDERRFVPALLALTIVSFTPSWLLWWVQPMKDAVFFFFVVAFLFLATRVCRVVVSLEPPRAAVVVGLLVTLAATMYAISGIRWYVGMLSWGVFVVALIVAFVSWRRISWQRAGIAVAAIVLTAYTLVTGSGAYMPEPIQRFFKLGSFSNAPATLSQSIELSRVIQERFIGSTTLREPPIIRKLAIAPRSNLARVIIGTSAMLVPRFIGSRLGLINVGGGRGLWLFADFDTLLFDATILCALALSFASRRRFGPFFWPLLLMTAALLPALGYVSTNFGTLFRHRAMILLLVSMLPLMRIAVSAPDSQELAPAADPGGR
jgi:hypothetical protein